MESIEEVLEELNELHLRSEITYDNYSRLHDAILKVQEQAKEDAENLAISFGEMLTGKHTTHVMTLLEHHQKELNRDA